MVTGGVLTVNPASAVRGPKYVIKKGKTPEEARLLLNSIDVSDKSGLLAGAVAKEGALSGRGICETGGVNLEGVRSSGGVVPARGVALPVGGEIR